MTAGNLNDSRASALRHRTLGRRRDHPVFSGNEVPARFASPSRLADRPRERLYTREVGHRRADLHHFNLPLFPKSGDSRDGGAWLRVLERARLLVDFAGGIAGEQKKSGGGVSVGAGGTSGGSTAAGVGVNLGSLFGGKGVDSVVRIDVVDRQQKQVIWGGSITQRVPADQKELTKEMIHTAVASIFAKYPKPVAAPMQKSEPPPAG
jgi:hypothetical protein